MLEKVFIRNFQSHQKSTIEFTQGVNIIVGDSDSGKSSIFRALRWLFWNKPLGDSYRSWWGGNTIVKGYFDDCVVSRVKTDSKSYYKTHAEEETIFKALKTSVPEEVAKCFNITEENIQRQTDSPFLLSNTSGEVASHLNKIANIEDIDKSRSTIDSNIRKLKWTKESKEQLLKKDEEELNNYATLEDIEQLLITAETLNEKIKNLSSNLHSIEAFIEAYKEATEEQKQLQQITKLEPLLNEIFQIREDQITLREEKASVKQYISQYRQNYALNLEWQSLVDLEGLVQSIFKLQEEIMPLQQEKTKLDATIKQLTTVDNSIKENSNFIKENELILEKETPNNCPFCGAKIKTNGRK